MTNLQKQIEEAGQKIFNHKGGSGKSIFSKDWWYGNIMDWSMKSDSFKTQMFRFVDVLPTLKNNQEVSRHLKEYFAEQPNQKEGQKQSQLPSIFNVGLGIGSLAPGLLANSIRKNVSQMARMFITGETAKEAIPVLKKSRKNNMAFTFDILGEACLSEKEASDYHTRYIELMDWLITESKSWKANEQIDKDHLGAIPPVNISVKLTALYSQIHTEAWAESKEALKNKLRPLLKKAVENFVFINIDMEKFAIKDLTLDVFEELLLEDDFKDYPHFGIVIQAYLKDSFKDCQRMVAFAAQRGVPFSIRLVKGAYWDYETIGAKQKGWDIPVYTFKPDSDANYENCTRYLLDNHKVIKTAIASHNVRSLANAIAYAEHLGLPKRTLEFQMLYGMADTFKHALVQQGYRLREYCPVGELLPGMSYLVRRLLENTSNESFLKSKFADDASELALLADPSHLQAAKEEDHQFAFENEALLDFAIQKNRTKMEQAIATFENKQLQKDWPTYIDNQPKKADHWFDTINPSNAEPIGRIASATIEQAQMAMTSAHKAFPSWQKTSVEERAKLLEKVAQIFIRDRFEIMAAQVIEAGKTWKEADGDVCEAVDFLNYYAIQMRELQTPQRVGHAPGEMSLYSYQGRGVNVVIAPWNFPLAILTGMVAGSLVTGNTVVFKPAEQTSMVATYLINALIEAGCPKGVAHMITGHGETVGAYLVDHPETAMVCFTGSKDVGLEILKKAAVIQPGQTHIKRCLTELGGKNAIIVDSDADLDEAVAGIVKSAFGFQGQKCSACSRVIVLEDNYERFTERLVEATRSLHVGSAKDPHSVMGPVIDKQAYEKICNIVDQAKNSSASLLFMGQAPKNGYFISPTIFENVTTDNPLARDEIFGPVLAVIKAKTLDDALNIANETEFALTGAFFSRSPANIEQVKKEFNVGNLYINQGSTGALVDRHPFGGFKLSGGGSKTGGPDYLKYFMDPKVITENTLRQGFAPEETSFKVTQVSNNPTYQAGVTSSEKGMNLH